MIEIINHTNEADKIEFQSLLRIAPPLPERCKVVTIMIVNENTPNGKGIGERVLHNIEVCGYVMKEMLPNLIYYIYYEEPED